MILIFLIIDKQTNVLNVKIKFEQSDSEGSECIFHCNLGRDGLFFFLLSGHILDVLCCATGDRQIRIHTKAPVSRVGG